MSIADVAPSKTYPTLSSFCDVRDAGAIREACAGADVIYNLSAVHCDDMRPRSLYREVNVDGAANICAAATAAGIDSIVFTSSVAIYGFGAVELDEDAPPAPFNDYGTTKLEAEDVFKSWFGEKAGRTLTIVRPTAVFGEGNHGNVFTLIYQIRRNRFVMSGSGDNNVKSIAYVENVAAFLDHVLSRGHGPQVYTYVDKPDYSARELVSTIRRQFGKSGDAPAMPYGLAALIGAGCDDLAAVSGRSLPFSRVRALASGFIPPVNLDEGMRRTIADEAVPALAPAPETPGAPRRGWN